MTAPPARGLALEVLPDTETVAARGAACIAEAAREAVAAHGVFAWAVSGGRTPWRMLERLAEAGEAASAGGASAGAGGTAAGAGGAAGEPDDGGAAAVGAVPWAAMHLFQADERVAPDEDDARNWTHVRAHLMARLPPGRLGAARLHPMPVGFAATVAEPATAEVELAAAARRYGEVLARTCGAPPVLDLVHLGLGEDGHTASLVPGDPVLEIEDADVAVTARPYQGLRRMTLTLPVLARARRVLWVVTGASKRQALARLLAGDASIPAGRVVLRRAQAGAAAAGGDRVLADRDAASR